jgi:hypothetical protein
MSGAILLTYAGRGNSRPFCRFGLTETEDATIADLAAALNAGRIKTGSVRRGGERRNITNCYSSKKSSVRGRATSGRKRLRRRDKNFFRGLIFYCEISIDLLEITTHGASLLKQFRTRGSHNSLALR